MAEERFDGMFMTVAQQSQGIEPLLDHLFGFLRRKTDFFAGASEEQVNAVVLDAMKKQRTVFEQEQAKKKASAAKEERRKKELAAKKAAKAAEEAAKAKAATSGGAVDDDIIELGADGTFDSGAAAAAAAAAGKGPTPPARTSSKPPAAPAAEKKEMAAAEGAEGAKGTEEEEEDDTPPPPGNGGTTDRYVWTQSLSEVTVNIPLPAGTKSKMLSVDIQNAKLKVALKGGDTLIDSDFHKRVIVDDSIWTLEDGTLVITLCKDNKMEWWKCVCEGDPVINTQKVQPENSKLGDLDGETRQTVEKMMFDQRQKQMGLPSSDELQKQEMLKKFMGAHPEMDFSQAKFT
jgi:hypothetical protein